MALQSDVTILNKYRIVKLLGEGGMARVWLAEEVTFDGRQVAIKEPKAGIEAEDAADVQRRFQQEISLTAALMQARAPNIVPAWTVEPLDGGRVLVMQYMPGGSLEELLRQPEHAAGLPMERAVAIALDVLGALEALHRLPMEPVHRDVKPSNILFDGEGRACLADFGLAQLPGVSGRSRLAAGAQPATPMYAAPEQLRSPEPLMPAADLFALGCVLWEMLTGKRYKRNRPGTLPGKLRSDVPGWLDNVVMRALAEDQWERWSSAGEMSEALHAGLQEVAQPKTEAEAQQHAQAEAEQRRKEAEAAQREAEERARQEAQQRALAEAEQGRKAAETALRAAEEKARQEAQQRAQIESALRELQKEAAHKEVERVARHGVDPQPSKEAPRNVEAPGLLQTAIDDLSREMGKEFEILTGMVNLGSISKQQKEEIARRWVRFLVVIDELTDRLSSPEAAHISQQQKQDTLRTLSTLRPQVDRILDILSAEPAKHKETAVRQRAEERQEDESLRTSVEKVDSHLEQQPRSKVVQSGEKKQGMSQEISDLVSSLVQYFEQLSASDNGSLSQQQKDEIARKLSHYSVAIDDMLARLATTEAADIDQQVKQGIVAKMIEARRLFDQLIGNYSVESAKLRAEAARQHRSDNREKSIRDLIPPPWHVVKQSEQQTKQAASLEFQSKAARQEAERKTGIELVRIPAGECLYGEDKRKVHLSEYWIAKTPVTNAQYAAFIQATGYRTPDHWQNGRIPTGKENHPVVYVNWDDAQSFCQWAGLRLPMELEWLKAARGTDGREYPWGNQKPDGQRCNSSWAARDTTPVGKFPLGASVYGVLDMAGNVWEWCEDWYDTQHTKRVLRGGSWSDPTTFVRTAFRFWGVPGIRLDNRGIRCAR